MRFQVVLFSLLAFSGSALAAHPEANVRFSRVGSSGAETSLSMGCEKDHQSCTVRRGRNGVTQVEKTIDWPRVQRVLERYRADPELKKEGTSPRRRPGEPARLSWTLSFGDLTWGNAYTFQDSDHPPDRVKALEGELSALAGWTP